MDKRKLSALLIVCILVGMFVPVGVTEYMPDEEIEQLIVSEFSGELGDEGFAPDADDVITPDADDAPEALFTCGYVRVNADNATIDVRDGVWEGALPEDAVLYAFNREGDRIAVWFPVPNGSVSGWVSLNKLEALDDDATKDYVELVKSADGSVAFDPDGKLLLLPIARQTGDADGFEEESELPDVSEDADDEEDSEPVDVDADVVLIEEPAEEDVPSEAYEAGDADAFALTTTELMLHIGKTSALNIVSGIGASDGVVWASADPSIATVDDDGNVTAVGVGVTTVTANATIGDDEGVTANCTVKVLSNLSADAMTLYCGSAATIGLYAGFDRANEVTWASHDPNVAAVDEGGVITAIAPGSTKISALLDDACVGECEVTVKSVPSEIRFAVAKLTIGVGQTSDALCIIYDENNEVYTGPVIYTTSNKRYCVGNNTTRIIKGLKKTSGVTIKATIPGGPVASCKVVVKSAPSKITAKPKTRVLGVGESFEPGYSLSSGSAASVTMTAGTDAVSIENNIVTAVHTGASKITLKTHNGKKAYCTVTVKNAPTEVRFAEPEMQLYTGMSVALSAAVDDSAASALAYSSDDPNVAVVSGSTLKAVSEGVTTIRVSTYNGLEDVCTVTVGPAPEYIALDFSKITIGVGSKLQLVPDVGASGGPITYSSSRKSDVTVSSAGVIKGKSTGSATVTLKTYNGKTFKLKVYVKSAPKKVYASETAHDLGVGEHFRLGYKLPSGTAGTVTFEPKDPEQTVLSIDPETGDITGLAVGEQKVVIRTYNDKTATCIVRVHPAPTSVSIATDYVNLGVGQSYSIKPVLSEGSCSAIEYVSSDAAVASVTTGGTVVAKQTGDATIRVKTYVPGVEASLHVKVSPAPTFVSLDKTSRTVDVNDGSFVIVPKIDEGARTTFTFATSNAKVATVDQSGLVRPIKRGKCNITVTTHNGFRATLALTIIDPLFPEVIEIADPGTKYLTVGANLRLSFTVEPTTAAQNVVWVTSSSSVASVDDDGNVTAEAAGYVTISAVSLLDDTIFDSVKFAVQSPSCILEIPARTTTTSGISANRAKIKAIKNSALKQAEMLSGKVSSSEISKRKTFINNIFACYDFVWMTPKKQLYWKAANSEGGAKDFKPGVVYYGMPYISGSGLNRAYDAAGAKATGKYVSKGDYLLLTKSDYNSRSYPGNDCSGLVDVAYWGMDNGAKSQYRTGDIAVSSLYRTVSYSDMRPGDLICKADSHVIMFLYYCNPEKTKMMIIENGGSEAGTNTVHCSVMNVKSYSSSGYKVRRLASFA